MKIEYRFDHEQPNCGCVRIYAKGALYMRWQEPVHSDAYLVRAAGPLVLDIKEGCGQP